MKKIIITEAQYKKLSSGMKEYQSFIKEMTELTGTLNEGTVLAEGALVDKFKGLMAQGGFQSLRRGILAAAAAGALLGVTGPSIAQAATAAGASPQEAQQLAASIATGPATTAPGSTNYAQALTLLNKRYVVSNTDPAKTKQFMKFSGDLKDVIGIGENGYPLFTKGSKSAQDLDASFKSPNIIKGIVNVRGKDYPGNFVLSNGLYYNIQASEASSSQTNQTPDPDITAAPPAQQTGATPEGAQEMYDYSGLVKQAQERFQFKTRGGQTTDNVAGEPKVYTNFNDYVYDFFRAEGKGLQGMNDDALRTLFAKGLKVAVPKGQNPDRNLKEAIKDIAAVSKKETHSKEDKAILKEAALRILRVL